MKTGRVGMIETKGAAAIDISPAPAGPAHRARETKVLVLPFEIKEIDDAAGTFSGIAAAYSLDQGGDIIKPGAFKRTLADWKRSKGKVIPLIDSHNYHSARFAIGKMLEATETADGLEAKFEFIPNDADADAIRRRVKGGYINGLSIGYETVRAKTPDEAERRGGVYRYLEEVKLVEVSVVVFPMNRDARIDTGSVKSFLTSLKADSLSESDRKELEQLQETIGALLAPAPDDSSPAPKSEGLAPDDPKRLEMERVYRDVQIRALGL